MLCIAALGHNAPDAAALSSALALGRTLQEALMLASCKARCPYNRFNVEHAAHEPWAVYNNFCFKVPHWPSVVAHCTGVQP